MNLEQQLEAMNLCQKRPTLVSKETYTGVKRDLEQQLEAMNLVLQRGTFHLLSLFRV